MSARKTRAYNDALRDSLDQTVAGNSRALAAGFDAWFSTMSECQREMIDFVTMRLAKDGDTMRAMLGCKHPADAMEIHSRWVQDTLKDYSAETTKIMAIYAKNAADAMDKDR